MNLHECQAKDLFAEYGVPVPRHCVVNNVSEVDKALTELGGDRWVLKAQVHAGGRGKAGGVKLTSDKKKAKEFVESMLGSRLVTFQTDAQGQPKIGRAHV